MKIKDIGVVLTGNTPKTSDKENYVSKDICFVKPSDLEEDEINYLSKTEFFISNKAKNIARILPANSVVVTCIGTIGKVGVTTKECAFNQQINAIIPNESVCLSEYLAYLLLSKKTLLNDIANAPVVPIINKSQFSEIEIYIPSIQKQSKILSTLKKVDDIIYLRKQQLSKFDELVKSRFIELFGDPITNSNNLPTERMELRFNLKAGITTAADDIHEFEKGMYEIPCYGGNGIRGYVREKSYTGNYPIIGRQGALCGNVQYATGEFHATEHAVLVSLLKNDNSVWVYHLLKLMDLFRYHTGAAQPGLAVKTLNTVEVIVADKRKQDQFAAFVEQADKSKLAIQKSLEQLETLKKSLMQQYFE